MGFTIRRVTHSASSILAYIMPTHRRLPKGQSLWKAWDAYPFYAAAPNSELWKPLPLAEEDSPEPNLTLLNVAVRFGFIPSPSPAKEIVAEGAFEVRCPIAITWLLDYDLNRAGTATLENFFDIILFQPLTNAEFD